MIIFVQWLWNCALVPGLILLLFHCLALHTILIGMKRDSEADDLKICHPTYVISFHYTILYYTTILPYYVTCIEKSITTTTTANQPTLLARYTTKGCHHLCKYLSINITYIYWVCLNIIQNRNPLLPILFFHPQSIFNEFITQLWY